MLRVMARTITGAKRPITRAGRLVLAASSGVSLKIVVVPVSAYGYRVGAALRAVWLLLLSIGAKRTKVFANRVLLACTCCITAPWNALAFTWGREGRC